MECRTYVIIKHLSITVLNYFSSCLLGLQAELQAAYKEGECVKKKLKLQESELDAYRAKMSETEDEQNLRYSK